MTGVRTMFGCRCHLHFLAATVSRLANASRPPTRLLNPGSIDGRHSRYAVLYSMIWELDAWHLLWTTDCNVPSVSSQKTAADSGVTSTSQPDYHYLTFFKSGSRVNPRLTLSMVRRTMFASVNA